MSTDASNGGTSVNDLQHYMEATSRLRRENEEFRRVLEFYAEWKNYRWAAPDERNAEHNESYCAIMQNDRWLGGEPGSRARAVLAGAEHGF